MINGVKTWCTFAARADVLYCWPAPIAVARLIEVSMFVVEEQGQRRGWSRPDRPRAPEPTAVPGAGRLGTADRHPRLPGHALVRAGLRELVRARGQPGRRPGRAGQGLLPPDAGVRERPPPDRSARPRRDAGGLRSGIGLCRRAKGVRRTHRRIPTDPGQTRPHGGDHPGDPPELVPRGAPHRRAR